MTSFDIQVLSPAVSFSRKPECPQWSRLNRSPHQLRLLWIWLCVGWSGRFFSERMESQPLIHERPERALWLMFDVLLNCFSTGASAPATVELQTSAKTFVTEEFKRYTETKPGLTFDRFLPVSSYISKKDVCLRGLRAVSVLKKVGGKGFFITWVPVAHTLQ